LTIAGYFLAPVYDTYYDSQWYHMDAIIHLAKGWNPYYEFLSNSETTAGELYLNHFPIASWIVSADIFSITGSLELSKCTTLFLIVGVFFYSQYFFCSVLKSSVLNSIIISFLLAANPISMLSIMSFYVDGQVAVFFFFVCISALCYFIEKKQVFLYLALISNLLLAHVKIMSSVYAIILFAVLFFCVWLFKTEKAKTIFIKLFIAGIITYAIIGFHPFISNWKNAGHPLYPAMGNTILADRMADIYPANFEDKNRVQRFFISFFAKPDWARKPVSAIPKKLFDYTALWHYGDGSIEMAGWGSILPEIFLMLVSVFIIAAIIYRKKKETWYIIGFIAVIISTILINKEAWLSRYVPQFWLIIITMLYYLFQYKWFNIQAALLSLLLFLNITIISHTYIRAAVERSDVMKTLLTKILSKQNDYDIYAGWTDSFKYRLENLGFNTNQLIVNYPKDTNYVDIQYGMWSKYRLKTEQKK
jgi:hypothetical protein